MTIPEINRRIKAWNWQENRQHQFIASIAYRLPQLISIAVLDGKNYPEIYEVFPNEFDEEEIKAEKKKLQTQKDIAYFQAWAESFNARQRKE